jgi:hypothetical protein
MNFTPNLGPKARVGYVVFGLILVALGLTVAAGLWSALSIAAGAVVMLEGAVGY